MEHLEKRSQELQKEVEHLLALMAEKPPTRVRAPRAELPPSKLELLEIYCEPNSKLTEVALQRGLKARRFTREDGDLSTKEGQQQLWKLIEQTEPEHIWVAPECRYWGNFSRLNRSKSTETAHKIDEGRKQEKTHLRLCCDLFWHQVIHRRHFHLEQPQGSEALVQKELDDVVQGTYRTVFDMCEVGGLRIPQGNNFLRKRTIVLTTSKSCHGNLDSRYCQQQHDHVPIQGKMPIKGRWENLSAFAAKYSRGFARNVIEGIQCSLKGFELPMFQEELCVPCHGVREHDQEEAAAEIIKRRRLNYKQAEESPSASADSSGSRARFGPAVSWKDIFKDAEKEAPRVGTVVISSEHELFHRVQMLVDSFDVGRVEVCRGTERYRVPKPGVDVTHLIYRLTVILNRESGNVEVLGTPEKWQDLPKGKQIRKSRPARLCLTIFGNKGVSEKKEDSLMKNLAEGDRSADSAGPLAPPSMEEEPMMDASMKHDEPSNPPEPEDKGEPDIDLGILGHPPKSVPRHGPRFLELGKEDRDWIRQVHHRMGHPDPLKFAQFLKSTHAAEEIIAGSLDFQCDSCLESQKGFKSTRQASIHRDLGFNEVVGMDVASWTNGRGQEFKFVHFLDEGTLFHVAQPCSLDTESQIVALENYWINWAGPPKELYTDPATGYTTERFLGKLQEYGIQMKVSARDSHWQLGRAEVHGSILKRMLERMDKEIPINDPENFRECLVQACIAKNALSRVKGYTPEQAVLGISRRLPASISSDSQQSSHALAAGDSPESDQFRLSLEKRTQARKAFIEADNCNSLRRALLRRSRPLRDSYEEGDWVLYWKRKGGNLRIRGMWHGPARIVMLEGRRIVWLVHANKLIRASPEQLRPASIREWQAVKDQEAAMHPVSSWMAKVQSAEYFDLHADEIPSHDAIADQRDDLSSGYTPSLMEPEREVTGLGEGEEVEVETDGRLVPIPDDDDGDLLFADTLNFSNPLTDQYWEIDITPSSWEKSCEGDPNEVACTATDLRKKRVEVKLKDLGQEDQLRFAAAKDKEMKAWLSHKTIQKVAKGKIPENAIMRCRWLLSWKNASGDEPPGELALNGQKAKARLVVIGFEDPQVDTVKNDAPTLTKDGRQVVLQQVSSHRWPLVSFDISTAFLHGKGDGRNLGLHPTPEIREALQMGESDQCALNGGAYGRVDAPYLWFCEIRGELLKQGCRQHPLDPCVFSYGEEDENGEYRPCGALGLHVDDGIGGGNETFRAMLKRVEQRFKFGSFETGEFKYTGIHFKQWDDGSIEYDQVAYIDKISPISIPKSRKNEPQAEVTDQERTLFRSLIGALQYAAVHTRPDLSAKVGELQTNVTRAKVEDLVQANRVLYEAKVNRVALMVLPIEPTRVTFCAFSDASFMSNKSLHAHQGTIIFVTNPELLENQKAVVAPIAWTSKKVPRIVRSTLSAEAAALSNSVDRLLWIRMMWAWISDPNCEWSNPEHVLEGQTKSAVVTDCRSMYDILTRTAVPSCSEHRTTIECLLIRERLKANCDVRWVSSQAMLADCLTKTMDASVLRQCLMTGRYSLFDEQEVLKTRADKRQRLQWIKNQAGSTETENAEMKETASCDQVAECQNVQSERKSELEDFWKIGPHDAIHRVHVKPRYQRFVPIGVTGCPVEIKCLSASRETRVSGWGTEKDFWTGSRGAASFPFLWTGETVFRKQLRDKGKND
jgi:hypothetical protein